MSQDKSYILINFSLAEALEEVATSITAEAWLNNEDAIYISFDYIHCFCFNLWGDWNVCTFELLWLFFGKEVVFSKITLSLFTLKEGSTSHPDPLTLREEEGNRPTRCSEPLRSKVGGASKPSPWLCGMGPLCYNLL